MNYINIILSLNFVVFLSMGVLSERSLSPYEYIHYNSRVNPYFRRDDNLNESMSVQHSDTDYNFNDNRVNTSTGAPSLELTNSEMRANNSDNYTSVEPRLEPRLEPNISNIVTNETKSALISIFEHFVNRYRLDDNRTQSANDSFKVIPEPEDSPVDEEYATEFYASTPVYDFDAYQSSR